jgi:hypothetical protein
MSKKTKTGPSSDRDECSPGSREGQGVLTQPTGTNKSRDTEDPGVQIVDGPPMTDEDLNEIAKLLAEWFVRAQFKKNQTIN